eukprot:g12113.t1
MQDTRKGVPVTHMVIGRTEAQDIVDFLDFVRKEEPDFYPELLVIDKCDMHMEAKDAEMFAKKHNLNIKIFICFFHSAQAIRRYALALGCMCNICAYCNRWLTTSNNRFPQEDVDDVMKMIRKLHHAKSAREYLELKDLFLQ